MTSSTNTLIWSDFLCSINTSNCLIVLRTCQYPVLKIVCILLCSVVLKTGTYTSNLVTSLGILSSSSFRVKVSRIKSITRLSSPSKQNVTLVDSDLFYFLKSIVYCSELSFTPGGLSNATRWKKVVYFHLLKIHQYNHISWSFSAS